MEHVILEVLSVYSAQAYSVGTYRTSRRTGSHTAQRLACKRVCYMGLKLKPALGLWYNLHCALT